MTNDMLTHAHEQQYQINLKNLESTHHKIMQSISSLTLLSDWLIEQDHCFYSSETKVMVYNVLCSSIDLLKQTVLLLPAL